MRRIFLLTLVMFAMSQPRVCALAAGNDDFSEVVKRIEQFYHVKHRNIPLLARAGVKAAKTAARIRGGQYRRLADAGSARVAFFEEQTFDSHGQIASFKASMNEALSPTWSLLVQTVTPKDEEQNYIYVREHGKNFSVLVITIERREATVVEANVAPDILAQLLREPGEMGKALTDDVTVDP